MSSSVCVDASLILRTLVPAPFSDEATRLLAAWQRDAVTLAAPALLAFEVTSSLRRLVHLREITASDGDAAFAAFMRLDIRLSQRKDIFPLAWHLAARFNLARAYDPAYLALAQIRDCEFWTADRRLYNSVGDALKWVRWVGDAPAAAASSL